MHELGLETEIVERDEMVAAEHEDAARLPRFQIRGKGSY